MELSDKRGRQRIITEITTRWIAKHQEELQNFKESVRQMRQGKPSENQGMILKATIPVDLMKQLDFALESTDDARLFNPDGEIGWFSNKFPIFIVPYDRHKSVR